MHFHSRLYLAVCLCLFFSFTTGAQQCDCGKEFTFLCTYIEKNYPGYNDKIPDYKDLNYKTFTEEYTAKTTGETNITYCMVFMKEWLKYFKDNHLQIAANPLMGEDSVILAGRIKNAETLTITPETLKELKKSKGVEGIYYEYDSVYKVAVIKAPNSWRTYAAVVLESRNKNWIPGMVKFEMKEKTDSSKVGKKWYPDYPCIFHMGNHGIYTNKIMSFSGFGLDGGMWKKDGLKESATEQAERNKLAKEKKTNPKKGWNYSEFNKPDDQVAYMRISNFDASVAEEIDSFVKANDAVVSSTPYLVLDLRGNGGGSDRSFQSLLPYIYTKPIISVGMGALATRDNIDADKAVLTKVKQDDIKRWINREITQMEENYGRYTPISIDTFKLDSVKRYPEKIVVLINRACASTTEQFLLAAQQSSKVVMMGETTDGTLDYSNKRQKKFPCIPYTLEYPITRSGRLPQHPIDNIGIKPDVPAKDDDNLVKEAIKYLKTPKR